MITLDDLFDEDEMPRRMYLDREQPPQSNRPKKRAKRKPRRRLQDPLEEDPLPKVIFSAIFGIVFIFLCPFLAYQGYKGIVESKASATWIETEMEVVSSRIIFQQGSRLRKNYHPQIEYSFHVEDKEYTGSGIRFTTGLYPQKADAEKVLAKYSVGSQHSVFYDPNDPNSSVLVAESSLVFNWIFMIVAIVFFFIALLVGFLGTVSLWVRIRGG